MDQDLRQAASEAYSRWRAASNEENRLRAEYDAALDRLAATRTNFKPGDVVRETSGDSLWRVDRVTHDWRSMKELDSPPLLDCAYIRLNGKIGKMREKLSPKNVVPAGRWPLDGLRFHPPG